MTQFTKFTARYAWNDTVHRVPWEGTVLRVVENGTVYKVNLLVFKSGSFSVADIKGSGTTSHWLEDFWKVYEHDANCGEQRANNVELCESALEGRGWRVQNKYLFPSRKANRSTSVWVQESLLMSRRLKCRLELI